MGLSHQTIMEAVGAPGVIVLPFSCEQLLEFRHTMGARGSQHMCHPSPLLPEVTYWFRRVGRAQTDASTLHGFVIPRHVKFYLLSLIS